MFPGNRGVIYTAQLLDSSLPGVSIRVAVKEPLHERYLKAGRTPVAATTLLGSENNALQKCDLNECCDGSQDHLEDACGEAVWLAALNPHGLGPRLLHADAARVVTEFADGPRILEYLAAEPSLPLCRSITTELLRQARRLDALGVLKGEFIRPDRHVLVTASAGGPAVVLLDFERCRRVAPPAVPKNVAQLCQFLSSPRFATAAAGPPAARRACGWRGVDTERLRALVARYQTTGQADADYAAVEQLVLAAWDETAQPPPPGSPGPAAAAAAAGPSGGRAAESACDRGLRR